MINRNLTKTILVALAMMTATPGLFAWKTGTKYATGTLTSALFGQTVYAIAKKKPMSTNELIARALAVSFGTLVTGYLHKTAPVAKAKGTGTKPDADNKKPAAVVTDDEAKQKQEADKKAKDDAAEQTRQAEEQKRKAAEANKRWTDLIDAQKAFTADRANKAQFKAAFEAVKATPEAEIPAHAKEAYEAGAARFNVD